MRSDRVSGPAAWGALARRGAAHLRDDVEDERSLPRAGEAGGERSWQPEERWTAEPVEEEVEEPRRPSGQRRPSGAEPGHRRTVPEAVVAELTGPLGATRGGRLAARLADASHAYERDRYEEARKLLRPIVGEAPDAAAARELYGLTLYRMGQWAAAARELEAYRSLTGSYDQHPTLADCYRALHRYADAEALWDDLRAASPDADLVAEGRIVAAGCLADQGNLRGAIALLERSGRRVEHPKERHLRQWYALADLYERAGELPRARDVFGWVRAVDPDAFDVRQRLRALR